MNRTARVLSEVDQPPIRPILVVEDQPLLHRIMRLNLEMDGLRVETATTVQEAMDRIRLKRPAVMIVDFHRPQFLGELVMVTLGGACGGTVPIVVVSGRFGVTGPACQGNTLAFLDKPFDMRELGTTVWHALKTAHRPEGCGRGHARPCKQLPLEVT